MFSTLKGINTPYSKKEAIQKHLELLKTYFRTEKTLVAYFKKHLMWYVKSLPFATEKKIKILEFTTLKEIEELLRTDKIFTTLNGHRWIINYDELEREILKLKHTFIR